jgi:membrane protein YdbS with pleckstrin-like domain
MALANALPELICVAPELNEEAEVDPTGSRREEDNWLAPSRRLLRMRIAEVLTVAVIALVGSGIALASSSERVLSGALAAAVVVVSLLGVWIAGRRYRSWGYCERSRDLLVRRGMLVRRLTVVPYGRMQLVDVTSGAVERIFGLATIKLHTAAATTDARIPGLLPAEATRLRDQLAAFGEAQAAGV